MRRHQGGWIITGSFVAALTLSIAPLPGWTEYLRPAWVTMVLIYWCMALPTRVGVTLGWLAGLFEDVLLDALLGQHALALAIVAFLILKLHQRLRVFPLGQQALTVFLLVALSQLLMLWIRGITGHSPSVWLYMLPAITSALLWPLVFVALRGLRRHFQVS